MQCDVQSPSMFFILFFFSKCEQGSIRVKG